MLFYLLMAHADADDLIARKDARVLGDLCSDDNKRVPVDELGSNTNVTTALDDASGKMDAALLQGKRYTSSDLSALTGNSLALRKRICCDIAFWLLWDRRPDYGPLERRNQAYEDAKEQLKMLREGVEIFDVDAQKTAGVPEITGPTTVTHHNTQWLQTRCQGHFYPHEVLPDGR